MLFHKKTRNLADVPCPVCDVIEFYSSDFPGSYFICSNCGWEDDDLQFHDPDFAGGANEFSLNKARKYYNKNSTASASDRAVARNILLDLKDAVKTQK